MQSIGFKNFRKFENFPTLELAPITILVGENNAGKSTVVKGILALSDFLKSRNNINWETIYEAERSRDFFSIINYIQTELRSIPFYFNSSYLTHIGTFQRAIYNKANKSTITFCTEFDNIKTEIEIDGEKDDKEAVYGTVSKIKLFYNYEQISIIFDLKEDLFTITFLHNEIENAGAANEDDYTLRLSEYFKSFNKDITITAPISEYLDYRFGDLFSSLFRAIENSINATAFPSSTDLDEEIIQTNGPRRNKKKPISGLDNNTINFIRNYSKLFPLPFCEPGEERFELPRHFFNLSRRFPIEYLYAHSVSQTVVYSAKDTNDYLSRTINDYASNQKQNAKVKHEFIVKWMKEFGVGIDFKIDSIGGEAHIVHITNNDGTTVNLSDKGMGSIQIMVMLLRLAQSIPTRRNKIINRYYTLIIEEPEQNLHPMLQSKLTDLFHELNTNYGFRFIIETHSEYLIRRSQVIVSEKYNTEELIKGNPFKVYYFPSAGNPYDMQYTTSGVFERKFGDGFFNEAGKLHMDLLRNVQKQS